MSDSAIEMVEIHLTVNGRARSGRCEPRKLLVDFLREDLVLTGTHAVRGKSTTERITWTPHPDGTVRQHWEQSTDGGQTWTTAFDGLYRRKS